MIETSWDVGGTIYDLGETIYDVGDMWAIDCADAEGLSGRAAPGAGELPDRFRRVRSFEEFRP
jgi:hypothetical protein